MAEIQLPVTGMTCGGCAASVERALARVEGVAEARVDLSESRAYVSTDGSIDRATLAAAVVGAGYGIAAEGDLEMGPGNDARGDGVGDLGA